MSMARHRMAARFTRGLMIAACLLCTSLPATGDGVPVQTIDGEPGDLVDFLSPDKWTVVMVWTTYCGICTEQYPILSRFHKDHADDDAVVLGLSLDGYGKGKLVAEYQAAQALNFPTVLTDAGAFAVPYELTTGTEFTGTPTYVIFDPARTIRAFQNGLISREAIEALIAE